MRADGQPAPERRLRIGIDTGGTFTDVVALDEVSGALTVTKTPSTPADPAVGFLTGLAKVLDLLGADPAPDRDDQPRHHHRDQSAAGRRGRRAGLHHHRGLRVHAGDRPPVGTRWLRQLLLLGQAGPDRAAGPGQDGRPGGSTTPALSCGRSTTRRRWPPPAGSPPAASSPSACASCTPTPTPPTRKRWRGYWRVSIRPRWFHCRRASCRSTASTSGR